MDFSLLLAIFAGIAFILVLILRFKMQAFIALLMGSILVGLLAGLSSLEIIDTIKEGMGGTLGFVATVVGLGAMFGAILEHSGGAEAVAQYLLKVFGEKRSTIALTITGFIVAIPVFFDVGFIILVPLIYSIQRKTKKSLLLYAFPLLVGLAVTHAFIPPTPGPVAVADILNADLGWVILFGFIVGLPTAFICGPIFSKYIANKIFIEAPELEKTELQNKQTNNVGLVLSIITIPIILIVVNTLVSSPLMNSLSVPTMVIDIFQLIGHPFSALIIANLLAWYFLGLRLGMKSSTLMEITTASMGPAGIIILLTGAGGVFKQTLINTGAGTMIAEYMSEAGMSVLLFAFIVAAIIRVLQGSATVAMITAAGVTAPLLIGDISEVDKAMIAISIAAGSTILSHVNDSGFWIVAKFLGLSEKQTLKSWTVISTMIALVGFSFVMILSLFV